MLTLNGICWCLLVSFGAWRRLFSVLWCLEMRGGCLRIYSKCLWVLFMDMIKVWVPLREYLSVQALYDAANALYWKISERRNSTHLAFLKHQNTKTSLCELSKNHWVIAPFYISGPIKRKLQSTVSLDHPVSSWYCNSFKTLPSKSHLTSQDWRSPHLPSGLWGNMSFPFKLKSPFITNFESKILSREPQT